MDAPALTRFHREDYGSRTWGKSHPDPTRCAESVYDDMSRRSAQCRRKRGHGPEGAFCKQHDPAAKKARAEAASARYLAEAEQRNRPFKQHQAMHDALRQIAEGHNDPRSLAVETLKRIGLA